MPHNDYWAHSRNDEGRRQPLYEHLNNVARLAEGFASAFDSGEAARLLGWWHDVGKYASRWQEYLLKAEAGLARRGPDHKAAGALWAQEAQSPLGLVVQAHHGGLRSAADWSLWIERMQRDAEAALCEAQEVARRQGIPAPDGDLLPGFLQQGSGDEHTRRVEMWVRMMLSCLVDADALDTEAHANPSRAKERGAPPLNAVAPRFWEFHERLRRSGGDSEIARIRNEIFDACLNAAEADPASFRLAVPTGGGKTLSGMGFALKHALRHGMQRVIVVVPYITITEQTASVYRSAFADDRAVLEHHSAVEDEGADEGSAVPSWRRLAAENWDAPVVVTTLVRLVEALAANKVSRVRRLHRLANAVLIIDEAQTIPPAILDPMLEMLKELVANYGTSVVFSTATQPAFEAIKTFDGAQDIVPADLNLEQRLERVRYRWPKANESLSWQQVAERAGAYAQSLVVVNTKVDARSLYQELPASSRLHLSTSMCRQHRSEVLAEVRRRLASGEPCHLVATQLIEAGVDLDFPFVMRALGPLDSIIQAAGRCNREGRLAEGVVEVFIPGEGRIPGGHYSEGARRTKTLLTKIPEQLHTPAGVRQYFNALYRSVDTDERSVQAKRATLDFPYVAEAMRVIDDASRDVFVPYDDEANELLRRLESEPENTRTLLRDLGKYSVSLIARDFERAAKTGQLRADEQLGIAVWQDAYDPDLGLVVGDEAKSDRTLI